MANRQAHDPIDMRLDIGIDLNHRYENKRVLENNYLQDRQAMKTDSFTGIRGFPNRDVAMWETMGPIADRSVELLGASALAIVEFRRLRIRPENQNNRVPAVGALVSAALPIPATPSSRGRR